MFRDSVPEDQRVVVDCLGFRQDKDAEIRKMAQFMADKAVSSGTMQEIGPLNPYERRIVHMAVAERGDATSESIGDAFMKTVIISGEVGGTRTIAGRRAPRSVPLTRPAKRISGVPSAAGGAPLRHPTRLLAPPKHFAD